jgi:uncharacterized coiled-coil protein SlyX
MWPFRRNVPDGEHTSCSEKLSQLENRLEQLEERIADHRLTLLDTVEKVSNALAARTRKRDRVAEEPETPAELLRKARMAYGVHAR